MSPSETIIVTSDAAALLLGRQEAEESNINPRYHLPFQLNKCLILLSTNSHTLSYQPAGTGGKFITRALLCLLIETEINLVGGM